FVGLFLAVEIGVWIALFSYGEVWAWIALPFQLLTFVHFISLIWARMRPLWWRILVSWPALWFTSGTGLALPWAVAAALGLYPWGWQLAFVIAAFGFWQSHRATPEHVTLLLDGQHHAGQRRLPSAETRQTGWPGPRT